MIKNSKQQWEVGAAVKVGFISGLTVIAKIPTPGDSAPDAYVLSRGEKFYSFVPHNGLSWITTDEARGMVTNAKRIESKRIIEAAKVAASHIAAAKLRAEFMS